MNKELIKFLQEKQTKGQWLEIANKFNVEGTNKEKSDFVRRLWKKHKSVVTTTTFTNGVEPYVINMKTTSSTYIMSQEELERLQWKHNVLNKVTLTKTRNINNVLYIGDLHLPFTKEGYLEFCIEQQERFNCGTVIFSGDLVDFHAQSFHNPNPDGLSAKDELILAVQELQKWYKAFPQATCLLGNHDRIVARKLFSVGLSQRWMKPLEEVLEVPNWKFVEQVIYNNVLYVHGEGGSAIKKAQSELMSVCQGHLHTEGYVQFLNGGKNFGMQVGCGIDFESYAFAYAQRGKKPVLSCGVILGDGVNNSPILIPFHD
jgi:hypothetical protein